MMIEIEQSKTPFFTILTASFNRQATIQFTLESIARQTFHSFEHIVIDGASSDRTVEILKDYERRYNLRWVSEYDEGIADALNKGLQMATGHYLIVLQADDFFIKSTTLESVYDLIKLSNKDIYSFPVLLDHSSNGPTLQKPIRHLWYNRFKFIFRHQGCFVKRRVFDKIGNFDADLNIAMDYDFFYRALRHDCSVHFGDSPIALMGGTGIGTLVESAFDRFKEEQLVQRINENNKYWRIAQNIFWRLYMPYKKKQLK